MSRKSFLLYTYSFVFCLSIVFFSCKKSNSTATLIKHYDFMLNIQNHFDTTIIFNDSETYRISNVILGEGRCNHIDCSTCPGQAGICNGVTYIYNKSNEMISIHSNAGGCRADLSDNLTMIDLEHEINPHFHFQIGLFKISPYPSDYANIDFNTYVSTFRIQK